MKKFKLVEGKLVEVPIELTPEEQEGVARALTRIFAEDAEALRLLAENEDAANQ